MNNSLRNRIVYRRTNTDRDYSSEEKENALYKSRLRTKKRKLMNERKKIALCSSKNSDYNIMTNVSVLINMDIVPI